MAPLWLLLSLLSAEGGVATGAYLLAYAVFLDHGPWQRRIGALLPCGAVVVVWQLAYQRLGYGTSGTGFYVDPAREPGAFAAAVLDRGPVLLASQWLGQLPMLYNLVSAPARRLMWIIALLVVCLLAFALAALLRRDRAARMWAAGMVLAVVPACSISLLSGRLLLFVSLGAMGLMAQFIGGLADRADWAPTSGAWRRVAWALGLVLVALHGVAAPIAMPIIARSPDVVQDVIERVTELGQLPAGAHAEVVVVNAPSPFEFIYLPSLRKLQGRSVPRVRMLAPGYSAVKVTRLDDHTVVMRPEGGYLAPPGGGAGAPVFDLVYVYRLLDRFFRSEAFPTTLGAEVTVGGMRAVVTGLTDDGRPSEARLRFGPSLEDPSLTWLYWDWGEGAYVTFAPPAIGESVRIPGPFEGSPPHGPAREGA
jgi:hypothetical protein